MVEASNQVEGVKPRKNWKVTESEKQFTIDSGNRIKIIVSTKGATLVSV